MTWDPAADAELQELYRLSAPGPQVFLPGHPLELAEDPDHVRPFVQACGVLYERDQVSLITDPAYDALAMWLGDEAATAMDWQGYPPESIALAGRLSAAATWRTQAITSTWFCEDCWDYDPQGCGCDLLR